MVSAEERPLKWLKIEMFLFYKIIIHNNGTIGEPLSTINYLNNRTSDVLMNRYLITLMSTVDRATHWVSPIVV